MKKAIIIWAIYLSGCFCSYKLGKYEQTEFKRKIGAKVLYSTSDRVFNLALSCGSWLSAAAWGIVIAIEQTDNETPAKW